MTKQARILRRLGIVGAVLVAPALGATAAAEPALGDARNHQHAYAAPTQSAPGHLSAIRAGLVPRTSEHTGWSRSSCAPTARAPSRVLTGVRRALVPAAPSHWSCWLSAARS